MNDLDGLGLALQEVGFIDLCLGIKPSIHTAQNSLTGFAQLYVRKPSWGRCLGRQPYPVKDLTRIPVRCQCQKKLSCFWDCFNLVDIVSVTAGGFHSLLWLIGSSEPSLQPTFENHGGQFCGANLSSLPCVLQPCFPSDLFLSYSNWRIFISRLQSFLEQSRAWTQNKFSRVLWPWLGLLNRPSVISWLESCWEGSSPWLL